MNNSFVKIKVFLELGEMVEGSTFLHEIKTCPKMDKFCFFTPILTACPQMDKQALLVQGVDEQETF